MENLKKGDKIKCIESDDRYLTKDKIYTFDRYNHNGNIKLEDDTAIVGFFPSRFEKVKSKFKYGDKIRCINNGGWCNTLKLNEIYTFDKYDPTINNKCQILEKPNSYAFNLNLFKKVEDDSDTEFKVFDWKTIELLKQQQKYMKLYFQTVDETPINQEVNKMEKPKTHLEKVACKNAVEEAVQQSIEAKQKEYQKHMNEYIHAEETVKKYQEMVKTWKEEAKELKEALGITDKQYKELF